MKCFLLTILIFLFISFNNVNAQWEYWDGSDFPTALDTTWHEEKTEIPNFSTIIDDPDISGNKLLKFDEPNGADQETWRKNWHADPDKGATLVFRMKGLQSGTYDRDWDIYIYNGLVRERLVSNGGTEIKFDKTKVAIQYNTDDWHIYRLTILGDQIELYIDEDPFSVLFTRGESNTENLFRFGDLGSSTVGTLYDWVAWNTSGAYPPGEGDPLPAELTGLPTALDKNVPARPESFDLSQNYPNPFNPTTEIDFKVAKRGLVTISVYNTNGQLVRLLLNEQKNTGAYHITWDGLNQNGLQVPSGIYIYSMRAESYSIAKKMTLIK